MSNGGRRQRYALPEALALAVKATLEEWGVTGKARRLWAHDASLWTGADEADWLGWLQIVGAQAARVGDLARLADEVRRVGFTHALLLGMGGSSLCPEVLKTTFGSRDGYPDLHVLDSTDPDQIRRVERAVDLSRTLVIVSSKSGSTLEPTILKDYFFRRVAQVVGDRGAGGRFMAITDPGSPLHEIAERDGFRWIVFGDPSIGGRYSALSDFGMVPAAIMGVDVPTLLHRAEEMVRACGPSRPVEENPGVVLGVLLGALGARGRDKVTIATSPGIEGLGAWLEQLLAESTGKEGKGLIPVDGERLGPPSVYGEDRLFVYTRLESTADAAQDRAIEALERAGHPVVQIGLADRYDLGQEFFRWEIATAVAGSILGINPFDQPDVEASKAAMRQLTAAYERTGALPPETPLLEERGVALFAPPRHAAALDATARADRSLVGYLGAHLERLSPSQYFAILAFVERSPAHEERLQAIRHGVRNARRVATCLGFGPRYLHSTGQAYKGGPNSGVFLLITGESACDLRVPGRAYTFGIVKAAQARGDFEVLAARQRRVLRAHLGTDVQAGLAALHGAVAEALA